MQSILRKGLLYTNTSTDIVEHDVDVDADQWSYDNKDVYRGSVDPEYISKGLNVYWLYDDNLKRVGLAEHEAKEPEVFKTLWFHDNPFATLYQDPSWKSTNTTLWSKLSNEAYQDFLEGINIHEEALNSGLLLLTPSMLINMPSLYTCPTCDKKTLVAENNCSHAVVSVLDVSNFSVLFVDDDFVIYEHAPLSDALSVPEPTPPQSDACAQEQQVELTESVDQESLDALLPPQESPSVPPLQQELP